MERQPSPTPAPRAPGMERSLRLVSRIALLTGLGAMLVLGLVIVFLGDDVGQDYFAIIRSQALTHRQLAPAMLVGGLMLLALVALVTWLVALYGSFRIAGPLYRFTENFRHARRAPPLGIRRDDRLQATARQLQTAWTRLHERRQAMAVTVAALEAALAADDADAWRKARDELCSLTAQVRIDD